MIATNKIAKAGVAINATADNVWGALTNPEMIKKYMFGTDVTTTWKKGAEILWKGKWQGKSYEDKGTILAFEPNRKLQYTHFSPLSGLEDKPENYHTVTIELAEKDKVTYVTLAQDNNANEEVKAHSEKNWKMMLDSLKKLLEKSI